MNKTKIYYKKYTDLCCWPTIPKELFEASVKIRHDLCILSNNNNLWVAGGKLRNLIANDGPANDWDLYFKNESDLFKTKNKIENNSTFKASKKIDDEFLISYDIANYGKIDLVKKYYNSPIDTLNDFDFTICCFAMSNNGTVWWMPRAINDLKDKKLILHMPSCPLSTQLRLQKYAVKGYTMPADQHFILAKMMKEKSIDQTIEKLSSREHNYVNKNFSV